MQEEKTALQKMPVDKVVIWLGYCRRGGSLSSAQAVMALEALTEAHGEIGMFEQRCANMRAHIRELEEACMGSDGAMAALIVEISACLECAKKGELAPLLRAAMAAEERG